VQKPIGAVIRLRQAPVGTDEKRRDLEQVTQFFDRIQPRRALRQSVVADDEVRPLPDLAKPTHGLGVGFTGHDAESPRAQETFRRLENQGVVVNHHDKLTDRRCA
jgi:hypothetical protein